MSNTAFPFHIFGFAGSLRKASYNRALLRAAQELVPEGMSLEIFDLDDIPLFNADVEAEGIPEAVRAFKARLATADGLLIVTPEYNWSIPGVLKNAIDWASRWNEDGTPSPLNGKPLAIMSAGGRLGAYRAQQHLRQSYDTMICFPQQTEVAIAGPADKFDAQLRLIDEPSRERVRKLLVALGHWIERLRDSS